ncbi:hypothetical protein ACFYXL_33075 [Streptomyces tsukubensis]|uniref:hypothetical protein n=1 Tax=Streptomyces tsukubensis TaxID=83656 RepID=UPI0036BD2751
MTRSISSSAAAISAILVLASCSRADDISPNVLVAVPDSVSLSSLHEQLPIHRMTGSPAATRLEEARGLAISECMGRLGYAYAPVAPTGPSDWLPPFGLERIDNRSGIQAEEPVEEPRNKAFGNALYGNPDRIITVSREGISVSRPAEGCMAEVEKSLLGTSRETWIGLNIQLWQAQAKAFQRLSDDTQMKAANQAWSACVHREGIIASDPQELERRIQRKVDNGDIQTAVTDVHCKKTTRYLVIAYGRLAHFQRKELDRRPGVERRWLALRDRQIINSR